MHLWVELTVSWRIVSGIIYNGFDTTTNVFLLASLKCGNINETSATYETSATSTLRVHFNL